MGVAFVEDSSLGITSKYKWNPDISDNENGRANIKHTLQNLTQLAQHWEHLLFSTGGAINLQKSHWYLVIWKWVKGKFKMASHLSMPAELKLTAGYSSSLVIVPRTDIDEACHTLGVYITPSGSQKKQAQVLRDHAINYYTAVSPLSLTPSEAFTSYISTLNPRLIYPPPCSSLTQTQCRYIQAPALAALLPKMPLNCHSPLPTPAPWDRSNVPPILADMPEFYQ